MKNDEWWSRFAPSILDLTSFILEMKVRLDQFEFCKLHLGYNTRVRELRMVSKEYLAVILGMGLVTFLPRWLPLVYLTKRSLPAWLVEWLDFIPAAILSAILLPALVTDSATRSVVLWRPEFIVAIPTFLIAILTKSLGATVIVGMVLFGLAETFL